MSAIGRNARAMKPQEYAWLKSQEFKPPIRRKLIAAYERIHEPKSPGVAVVPQETPQP